MPREGERVPGRRSNTVFRLFPRGRGVGVAILVALSLLSLALVACVLGSAFVAWRLLHPVRIPIHGNPAANADLIYRPLPARGYLIDPSLQPLTTSDHVALQGWFIPAPLSQNQPWPTTTPSLWSEKTVIIATNHGQNRLQTGFPTYAVAATLVSDGYNVILFDFRGTGTSGGPDITFGVLEVRDLLALVHYALSLGPPGGRIAIWGFGTGAAAAIGAAAVSPHVDAVIADSSYATLDGYLLREIPRWTHLPDSLTPFTLWTMEQEAGVSFRSFNPVQAIAAMGGASPRPLLLVTGADDTVTPPEDAQRLYAAAADPRSFLLTVPNAGHLQAYAMDPHVYLAHVLETLQAMGR